MNLLHKWFGDRRSEDTQGVKIGFERRGGILQRHQAAAKKLEKAVDELNQTLSMSRSDFHAMLAREAGEHPSEVILFEPFADICEFRYSPKDSLMALCQHPEHDAHSTGIAACREGLCPKLLAAARKK